MDDSEKSICFIDKLVWLSGQCSPCRKREMQVITQQCGVFNRDSKFDICWQEEKLRLMQLE